MRKGLLNWKKSILRTSRSRGQGSRSRTSLFCSRDSEKTLINLRTQSCYSRDKVDPPNPRKTPCLPATRGQQRASQQSRKGRLHGRWKGRRFPLLRCSELILWLRAFSVLRDSSGRKSQFLKPTERWAKTAAAMIQARNQHR